MLNCCDYVETKIIINNLSPGLPPAENANEHTTLPSLTKFKKGITIKSVYEESGSDFRLVQISYESMEN